MTCLRRCIGRRDEPSIRRQWLQTLPDIEQFSVSHGQNLDTVWGLSDQDVPVLPGLGYVYRFCGDLERITGNMLVKSRLNKKKSIYMAAVRTHRSTIPSESDETGAHIVYRCARAFPSTRRVSSSRARALQNAERLHSELCEIRVRFPGLSDQQETLDSTSTLELPLSAYSCMR